MLGGLLSTCRVSVFGREIEERYFQDNPGTGLLYATWHRGLIYVTYHWRDQKFVIMASASRDGEMAAQVCRRFGWVTVRGSSSRRGSRALREMTAYIRKGYRGGLVVDAPRGPRCVAKGGIVALAKWTGLPILPVMWGADRFWRAGSWDRTIVPKPFSRIVLAYGSDLVRVPRNADRRTLEAARLHLDRTLNTLMHQTDRFFRTPGVSDPRHIVVNDPRPE